MSLTDTIIAFDLHSVVFTPNWPEVIKIFWRWPHKLQIIACMFRPRFVWHCLVLFFNEPTDEEFFALFHEHCPKLLPLAIELFNSFKPMDGTIEIIKELHAKGYALHILSNVGPRRFKRLQERFAYIMNFFSEEKINNGKAHHIIKKPNPQFFIEYLHDHNPTGKRVIFIDDNKQNVRAAEALGIIGIRFKSPAQLRNRLVDLHILAV